METDRLPRPDQPLRVLHLARTLGLGGTEKVLELLVRHLDPDRFAPTVHAFESGPRAGRIREAGIDTHIGADLLALVHTLRPHIVHVHRAGWPEPEPMRTLRLARRSMPAGPDGGPAHPPVIVETNVFGRHDPTADILDCTLFVSDFCARRFARETGIPARPPRYRVLPNPVDTDFFAASSSADRDGSRPVAGRISRADPGKWSRLALDILPILAERVPGFRYHVVGAIPEAREFVRTHGLEEHVVFEEPVATEEGLAAFYDRLSVLAHANDTGESFGLVIAEAMACSLPVVTHPAADKRDNAQLDLVQHGRTGLVAETAEDYANAVAWCFSHPEEAAAMGRAGRERIAEISRVQDVARRLEDVYLDLLARARTGADVEGGGTP